MKSDEFINPTLRSTFNQIKTSLSIPEPDDFLLISLQRLFNLFSSDIEGKWILETKDSQTVIRSEKSPLGFYITQDSDEHLFTLKSRDGKPLPPPELKAFEAIFSTSLAEVLPKKILHLYEKMYLQEVTIYWADSKNYRLYTELCLDEIYIYNLKVDRLTIPLQIRAEPNTLEKQTDSKAQVQHFFSAAFSLKCGPFLIEDQFPESDQRSYDFEVEFKHQEASNPIGVFKPYLKSHFPDWLIHKFPKVNSVKWEAKPNLEQWQFLISKTSQSENWHWFNFHKNPLQISEFKLAIIRKADSEITVNFSGQLQIGALAISIIWNPATQNFQSLLSIQSSTHLMQLIKQSQPELKQALPSNHSFKEQILVLIRKNRISFTSTSETLLFEVYKEKQQWKSQLDKFSPSLNTKLCEEEKTAFLRPFIKERNLFSHYEEKTFIPRLNLALHDLHFVKACLRDQNLFFPINLQSTGSKDKLILKLGEESPAILASSVHFRYLNLDDVHTMIEVETKGLKFKSKLNIEFTKLSGYLLLILSKRIFSGEFKLKKSVSLLGFTLMNFYTKFEFKEDKIKPPIVSADAILSMDGKKEVTGKMHGNLELDGRLNSFNIQFPPKTHLSITELVYLLFPKKVHDKPKFLSSLSSLQKTFAFTMHPITDQGFDQKQLSDSKNSLTVNVNLARAAITLMAQVNTIKDFPALTHISLSLKEGLKLEYSIKPCRLFGGLIEIKSSKRSSASISKATKGPLATLEIPIAEFLNLERLERSTLTCYANIVFLNIESEGQLTISQSGLLINIEPNHVIGKISFQKMSIIIREDTFDFEIKIGISNKSISLSGNYKYPNQMNISINGMKTIPLDPSSFNFTKLVEIILPLLPLILSLYEGKQTTPVAKNRNSTFNNDSAPTPDSPPDSNSQTRCIVS